MAQDDERSGAKPGPIRITLPDGRVIEAGVVLTVEELRDPAKTVLRMHGASPQMLMSAKDALVLEDSAAAGVEPATKIEVVGRHKTDMVVYYAPHAFAHDQDQLMATVNKVFAQKLSYLEKERERLAQQVEMMSGLVREARAAVQQAPAAAAVRGDGEYLTDDQKEIEVIKIRKESTQIIMDTVMTAEREKAELSGRIAELERQLGESVSAAQYSRAMEGLENEFYTVNNRAMVMIKNADLRRMDPADYQPFREFLPRLAEDGGEPRLLTVPQVAGEGGGLCEGTHVLVRYKLSGENRYFLGRLFFNDRQDYLCLGQGVDITNGVYGDRDRGADLDPGAIRDYLLSRPMTVLIYLDVLRSSSIQTVQFWLHYLTDEQVLEVRPVDDLILPLLD
ncbi:MAG: hypothetical protein MUF78_01870 [Candidatus Edwardsbacteria bacterium]|jgi:hypothetical protein|nr:hypothetical protein [Candidatus Edwardsbacteria bacterium]